MLLYRVFRHLATARSGESGHPMYLHKPQGMGRWDNPTAYDAWYLSRDQQGAVGETLGDLPRWRESVFPVSSPAGGRLALGVYEIPDGTELLDLDDARTLLDRSLRPTQVVIRNRSATQDIALRAFRETRADGTRKWVGISWWSVRWPQWKPICLWVPPGEKPPHKLHRVERLDMSHPAVIDAAKTLAKKTS